MRRRCRICRRETPQATTHNSAGQREHGYLAESAALTPLTHGAGSSKPALYRIGHQHHRWDQTGAWVVEPRHRASGDSRAHKPSCADCIAPENFFVQDAPQSRLQLSFAKMPSVFIFIAFQIARVGGSERLLTVKKSGTLFNSSAGRSFGEGQTIARGPQSCLWKRMNSSA